MKPNIKKNTFPHKINLFNVAITSLVVVIQLIVGFKIDNLIVEEFLFIKKTLRIASEFFMTFMIRKILNPWNILFQPNHFK